MKLALLLAVIASADCGGSGQARTSPAATPIAFQNDCPGTTDDQIFFYEASPGFTMEGCPCPALGLHAVYEFQIDPMVPLVLTHEQHQRLYISSCR